MKFKELMTLLRPNERISITNELGLICGPKLFKDITLSEGYEILDDEVMEVYYDREDDSLTIDLALELQISTNYKQ